MFFILFLFLFSCLLSLIELYIYFLSPFKNNSFFASYLSALASPMSHCLDGNSFLGCREAKHTGKLNSHKQRKLQLDSLAVTDKLTPHWLGFKDRLLISTRSPPGHLFYQLPFACSLPTVLTIFSGKCIISLKLLAFLQIHLLTEWQPQAIQITLN